MFVDKQFEVLVVYVVVACSVDEQQVALKVLGVFHGCCLLVSFGVVLWCVHVALLIYAVVELLVRDECYGDTCLEELGVAEANDTMTSDQK